ncbi:MAG: GIN domain-containing protein, partial [Chitinophagales bacterium]
MNKFSILLLIILAVSSSSFAQNNSNSPQQRDLKNFSSISLNIPAEATLKQGDYSFSISAPSDVLEKIKTEVKNNELVIRVDNGSNLESKESIRIEISLPSLSALEVNGSGEFTSSSNFNSDHLDLEINGSGKISLTDLTANQLSAAINGSGRIEDLQGTSASVKMQVNG